MELLELKKEVNLIEELEFFIRKYRLEKEIEYHKEAFEGKKPEDIDDNENIFQRLKKRTKNTFNKNDYENHLNKFNDLNKKYEELIKDKNYDINDINAHEKSIQLFKDDLFGVSKLEFAMNVVLDDYVEYECNDKTYGRISLILGYTEDFLTNLTNKMSKIYTNISLDRQSFFNSAITAGLIVGGVALVCSGIGAIAGVAVGAASTFTITGALWGALCLGSAVGTITYIALKEEDKSKLKKDFAKLNLEQTAMSLTKTVILLKQLDNYKNEEKAVEVYNSLIEEYIDLKSDVDLRILVGREEVELNNKKMNLFTNAYNQMKSELNIA